MYQYETKKTREPVVQRYEIIDKRKISDDYSLQMIDSHFFYAKQGLFKSDDLAGRPFHLQKKETIDGYDKITGKYKKRSGHALTAPSDCGLFAGLVLNNERPKAAFLFNDVLQQTDAQTDPSSYRPYIIRHLLAYVHTVPDDVMAGALDESSLLRSLCAQIPNAPDRKLDMRSQRRALKINTHKIIHIVLEAVCKNLLQALAVKAGVIVPASRIFLCKCFEISLRQRSLKPSEFRGLKKRGRGRRRI